MIGKDYFARQATTLLRMAKTVKDPQIQAGLAAKAADLKDRHEETPPTPTEDASPLAPDI